MPLRTVAEALAALSKLTNYERTRADGPRAFDLTRPLGLLERLGGPDRGLGARVAQVAGTKGKGSTSRFLARIWREAGYRTGRYSSPHLESVLERITVDGARIGERAFAGCIERTLAAVDTETTFFEVLLAAACLHFAECGTDAVVFEVGLGGRLDATTAVPTTHTIITEISYDHTEILGNTLPQIAAEKAGTIRRGVPVWSGVDPATQAGRVIAEIARDREAPLVYVPPPDDVFAEPRGLRWGATRLRTLGRHQAHNAALAAEASGASETEITAGIAATEQPGCCEPRDGAPPVILDGAHTVSSVRATLRAVSEHFPDRQPAVVFALAQDKDLDGIARLVAAAAGSVACVQVDDKRGIAAGTLAAHPAWNGRAVAYEGVAHATWRRALDDARATAGPSGLVLATGSLYLAGALRPVTQPWRW